MENYKAYDLPIRVFHWIFAGLFVMSFSIAQLVEDESSLYAYHMLSGILMVLLVILRIIWGVFGSKTSRFSSFQLSFHELKAYLKTVISSKSKRYLGHNPASSYAAVLMMVFTIGIGLSGLMMSLKINKHFFKEVHELLANGFFLIVIIHIVGVLYHQMKHNDGMSLSMINGKKSKIDGEVELESNHLVAAMITLVIVMGSGSLLLKNFDEKTGKLSFLGTQLQLGENEHGEHNGKGQNFQEHDDDDDD